MTTDSEQLTTNRDKWISFWASVFAAWGYSVSVTIANAMLPQIQGDLSASLDQVSWIITASIVAAAIGIPPTPWLAARYGLKNVLLCALVVFAIASSMLPFSRSLGDVVFWRIVQSLFGVPIMVLSQTLTVGLFKGKQRGVAMAVWSVALTTGWVFGPAIGAAIADLYSWRVAFFMVGPVALLSIPVCWYFLKPDTADSKLTFDWFGFAALSIGLVTLQIIFNRGQREDWFESREIVTLSVISVISLVVYVLHSINSDKRFIRWEIFRDRNLTVACFLTSLFGFVSLAPLVLVPPMLAQIKGLDVVTIGLVVTPRGILQIILMLTLGPFIARLDGRILMAIGFVSYTIGSWMMANYTQEIGMWNILIPSLLQGVTSALVWLPLFHTLYATLHDDYHNEASMSNMLVYNLVSSAGVALLVVILSRSIQINTEELGAHITSTRELLRYPQFSGFDFKNAADAAAIHAAIGQQALMIGYVNVFWLLGWISLGAVPLLLLVPSKKQNLALLKRRSEAQSLESAGGKEVPNAIAQSRAE